MHCAFRKNAEGTLLLKVFQTFPVLLFNVQVVPTIKEGLVLATFRRELVGDNNQSAVLFSQSNQNRLSSEGCWTFHRVIGCCLIRCIDVCTTFSTHRTAPQITGPANVLGATMHRKQTPTAVADRRSHMRVEELFTVCVVEGMMFYDCSNCGAPHSEAARSWNVMHLQSLVKKIETLLFLLLLRMALQLWLLPPLCYRCQSQHSLNSDVDPAIKNGLCHVICRKLPNGRHSGGKCQHTSNSLCIKGRESSSRRDVRIPDTFGRYCEKRERVGHAIIFWKNGT